MPVRRHRGGKAAHPRRLGTEPLTVDQQRDLVEDRYDTGSILITSQLPVYKWYDVIGDGRTLADAILDRLVHNAYRIDLSGESLRKKRRPDMDA